MSDATVTKKVEAGTLRERVLQHLETIRAPVVGERDAMAAELDKAIANGDGNAERAVRARLKAFNNSGKLYDIDQLRAAVHRDGNAKPLPGVKSVVEQVAAILKVE